ncbi:MAG: hypothetical protein L6R38_006467 [Xanthoria sp. 2 TBL-2021]|nr:MAG: hypothetical protein L6R38_006467 [Xanthoria sp. 2 TBL-2021]
MGGVDKYSVRALRSSPLRLLLKDFGVLLTVLPYLPLLFFPLNTESKEPKPQGASKVKSIQSNVIQALLGLLEIILLILFIPGIIALPGLVFLGVALLCILVLRLIAWPTQGPRILYSAEDTAIAPTTDLHPHERWVFINGICTGSSGLQANIDRLSHLFGRQVLGIHNQSWGLFGDLLECLLQRCLDYKTLDARVACEIVKEYLVDKEVEKLVLLAHSQGGIIASMVVDAMLMELPADVMGKLEIYTFGSAASHFHNPPTSSLEANSSSSSSSAQTTAIPYIEHYANEYDMVPRWGVLYATCKLLNNRYAGNVFIRDQATGHMFVDHYLDPIFPIAKHGDPKAAVKAKRGQANGNGDVNGQGVTNGNGHLEEALSYLDSIVDVDDAIPLKRRNTTPLKPLAKLKDRKNYGTVQNHHIPASTTNGNAKPSTHGIVDGFDAIGGDALMEQAARGKTVKELSRLWRYLGGSSPEERQKQDVRDRAFGRAIVAGRRGF